MIVYHKQSGAQMSVYQDDFFHYLQFNCSVEFTFQDISDLGLGISHCGPRGKTFHGEIINEIIAELNKQ